MTLIISTRCHYAGCRVLFIVMLNLIMMSVLAPFCQVSIGSMSWRPVISHGCDEDENKNRTKLYFFQGDRIKYVIVHIINVQPCVNVWQNKLECLSRACFFQVGLTFDLGWCSKNINMLGLIMLCLHTLNIIMLGVAFLCVIMLNVVAPK